jgi:hypothetical protein
MKEFAAGVTSSVSASKVPSTKRKSECSPFTSLHPCSTLEEPAQKPIIPAGKTPGKKKTVKAVFTHAENATHEQRIEILDWYHSNGRNQTRTAKHFAPKYPNLCLKQPKIAEWVKNESRYRELHAASVTKNVKRMRQTQHPEVTEMLELWVEQAMRDKIHVSGEVLRQKWTEFAVLCGVPEDDRLALSEGWLGRLKARLGLREFKRHGEAASASPEAVEAERKRVQELIQKGGFRAHDIYNMDETGLFYGFVQCFRCLPDLLSLATDSLRTVDCRRKLIAV